MTRSQDWGPDSPVEEEQGDGEGEPDADEDQLLLAAGQHVVNNLEAWREKNEHWPNISTNHRLLLIMFCFTSNKEWCGYR